METRTIESSVSIVVPVDAIATRFDEKYPHCRCDSCKSNANESESVDATDVEEVERSLTAFEERPFDSFLGLSFMERSRSRVRVSKMDASN